MPDKIHEAPTAPIVKAFTSYVEKLPLEDQKRFIWTGAASNTTSQDDRLREMQPDGSITSSTRVEPGEDKLMLVVEVANSQTLREVQEKIGRWILENLVECAIIVNIDSEDEIPSKVSFELWKSQVVPSDKFPGAKDHITNQLHSTVPFMLKKVQLPGMDRVFLALQTDKAGPYILVRALSG
jgi:hypothetical protein